MIHITGTFKEGWYSAEATTGGAFDYTYTEETGWSEDPNHAPTQLEALSTVVMTRDNVGVPPGSGHKPSFDEPPEIRIFRTIDAYLSEFCEVLNIDTDLFDDAETGDGPGEEVIH